MCRTYELLKRIFGILEQRILDKNDAKAIFIIASDIFESLLLKSYQEKDTFRILNEQLDFLNLILK